MVKVYQLIEKMESLNFNEQEVKIKNTKTGEMLGALCQYVADNIIFLFADKEGDGTCQDIREAILYECLSDDWNDEAYELREVRNPKDIEDWEYDVETLSDEELIRAKEEVVTGFPLRIYTEDAGDCPFRNKHQIFDIKGFDVDKDTLYLLY